MIVGKHVVNGGADTTTSLLPYLCLRNNCAYGVVTLCGKILKHPPKHPDLIGCSNHANLIDLMTREHYECFIRNLYYTACKKKPSRSIIKVKYNNQFEWCTAYILPSNIPSRLIVLSKPMALLNFSPPEVTAP